MSDCYTPEAANLAVLVVLQNEVEIVAYYMHILPICFFK